MKEDRTTVTEFILMCVTQNPLLQRDLFLLLLISYIVIVMGNMLTVVTTIGSQTLDSLMCFFLAFSQAFSSCKGMQTSHCGFFCHRAWAPGYVGFSSWGAWL